LYIKDSRIRLHKLMDFTQNTTLNDSEFHPVSAFVLKIKVYVYPYRLI